MAGPAIPNPAPSNPFNSAGALLVTTGPDGIDVVTSPEKFDVLTANLAALNSVLIANVADAASILMHVKNTGTAVMAAGAFAFEGSVDSTDGVNGTWFSVMASQTNLNNAQATSGTLSLAVGAGMAQAWRASVNGISWFRIRCNVAVTASALATWTLIRGSYATEPAPAVTSHPVTGSGVFTVAPAPASAVNYSLVTAASTNLALIRTGVGLLTELSVFNNSGATIYVKLYNKATAPLTASDVPIVVIPVAAGAAFFQDFGPMGKKFALGMGIGVTGAAASTDATAVAAGIIIGGTYI